MRRSHTNHAHWAYDLASEASALRQLRSTGNTGRDREGRAVMSDLQDQIVALVTENLTRRQLDDFDPVTGTPLSAERWLGLVPDGEDPENRHLEKLSEDEEFAARGLRELVSFAATAVEMWAMYAGKDPLELVRAVASRLERDEP
jgi:hypothetical protein